MKLDYYRRFYDDQLFQFLIVNAAELKKASFR